MISKEPIPISIITGFLGSGKTTFINSILKSQPEEKFVIIENEFGETAIDGGLILSNESDIYELSNGCVCCQLDGELEQVLINILEYNLDCTHILIECSGIAEPSAIIQSLQSTFCKQYYKLNAVLCICDAENFYENLRLDDTAFNQIFYSDFIFISKCKALQNFIQVKKAVNEINPAASVVQSHYGEAEIAFSELYKLKKQNLSQYIINHNTHSHKDYNSISINISHLIKKDDFLYQIDFIYHKFEHQILRIKALLFFEGEPYKYVYQSLRQNGILEKLEEISIFEEKDNKIVIIGKNLEKNDFENIFSEL